nr:chitin deacetylase 8-like [Dermacentor andersoni]
MNPITNPDVEKFGSNDAASVAEARDGHREPEQPVGVGLRSQAQTDGSGALVGDAFAICQALGLSRSELVSMSVRQLNVRVRTANLGVHQTHAVKHLRRMLKNRGYAAICRYDCTLVHQRVRRGSENPFYPYTMDFGFRRSCMVYPCPERTYPGLWVVPMNVVFRERAGQDLPCAMADICVLQPITANETFECLRSNFEDFYTTNRAPFPLFLHEAYLQQPSRKQGYLQFVDWLLQKDDVFLVTISEVLRFMQDPKPLGAYVQHTCPGGVVQSTCPKPNTCAYKNTSLGGDRYMTTCSQCPKNYPWVGNPMGN